MKRVNLYLHIGPGKTGTTAIQQFLIKNKSILKEKGYQLIFGTNGEEGVTLARQKKPALILMDVMMPVMDGYTATKTLKARSEFKKIPIIAMTARAMNYDRQKALEVGYDDYLAKPFTLEEVSQKIEYWLDEGE